MRIQDIQSDLMNRRPVDNSHMEMLMEVINSGSNDTKKLLEMMMAILSAVSEKKELPKPEVNVNFDMAQLAQLMNDKQQTAPEIKMPEVNFTAPEIDLKAAVNEIEMRREAVSYEFNIKRGTDGKIVSVIANPIGVRS